MKKLMIAAAIVCAAAFAQAANVKWSVTGVTPSPAEGVSGGITSYYVYSFVTGDNGAGTDTTFFSVAEVLNLLKTNETALYTQLAAAYGGSEQGYVGWDGAWAGESSKGIDATGASDVNKIILNTASVIVAYDDGYGVADYQVIEGTAEFQSPSATPISTLTASEDNWNSVPEPTSGLLLLLGVAGLALKRKRA